MRASLVTLGPVEAPQGSRSRRQGWEALGGAFFLFFLLPVDKSRVGVLEDAALASFASRAGWLSHRFAAPGPILSVSLIQSQPAALLVPPAGRIPRHNGLSANFAGTVWNVQTTAPPPLLFSAGFSPSLRGRSRGFLGQTVEAALTRPRSGVACMVTVWLRYSARRRIVNWSNHSRLWGVEPPHTRLATESHGRMVYS